MHRFRRRQLLASALLLAVRGAPAQAPQLLSTGRIERWPNMASKHVDARHIDVWLPPGYHASRRHAVLYMHDGQMLFDASTTWNKKAWRVDAVAAPLLAAGQLRNCIVVGVWNNGARRHAEYFPQAFLQYLPADLRRDFTSKSLGDKPQSDAYLRFLVEELKPAIDARYATLPDRENTVLMGSSMGGLISVYGLLEYPQVFSAAAALSTHWIGSFERNEAIPGAALAYLRDKLPGAGHSSPAIRLYMDRGTTELDALYDQAQPRVDALLAQKGCKPPAFVSRVFEGTGHNEDAWSQRLHIPLAFLLA